MSIRGQHKFRSDLVLDRFRRRKWKAPSISNETINRIRREPRIWLRQAIEMMAFGDGDRPSCIELIAAKQQRACKALCDAARHERVNLIGNRGGHGNRSDPIPPTYFDYPRCLGHEDNAIETDASDNAVGITTYVAIREDQKHKRFPVWSHVRIETESFLVWFQSQLSSPSFHDERRKCKDWLVAEMRKSLTERVYPKKKFLQEAQRTFQGISKRAFQNIWSEAIKESGASAWAKAGAPRKK